MRAALVLVMLALAGCASPSPEPQAPPSGSPAEPAAEGAPPVPGFGIVAFGAAPVDVSTWQNGSFRATQASRLSNEVPRLQPPPESPTVVVDVTKDVPRGVPVRILAKVEGDVGQGDFDLNLNAPDEVFRYGRARAPYGAYSEAEWGIVHRGQGNVEVVLTYDVAAEAPEAPYSLVVRVVHEPHVAPQSMTMGLSLPEGASEFSVLLVGERLEPPYFEPDKARLMVWDPADAFVGSFELNDSGSTRIALPTAQGGEYAVMLSQGGRSAVVHAPDGSSIRPLDHEWVVTQPHPGQSPSSAEWSFTLDRVPLLAGIAMKSPPVVSGGTFALESPEAPLFSWTFTGNPRANPGAFADAVPSNEWWEDSGFGVGGLAAGAYKARIQLDGSAGADPLLVWEYAAYHKR